MALATRCPACGTVFRISTAQATAKGGMVRCGQCRNVFDSLDALVRVEDLEVIEEVQVAPDGTAGGAAISTPLVPDGPIASQADAVDADRDDEATARPALAAEQRTAEADIPAAEGDGDASPDAGSFEATRHDPVALQTAGEWWLPDPADRTAPSTATATDQPDEPPALGHRDDAGRLLSGRRTDLQASGMDLATGPTFMDVEGSPAGLGRTARWTLGVLSLIAAVALVGQLAYLWRDEIAARWPTARPWLAAACGPLRCRVGYPAHLESITIESATIQTTGANLDVYVLNALLRNRDASDVRYPHLELVLTDLQDRPILRRALRPEDYLPAGRETGGEAGRGLDVAARSGFAAQSELPIHVTFQLGDLRFAGYRLDKFYP